MSAHPEMLVRELFQAPYFNAHASIFIASQKTDAPVLVSSSGKGQVRLFSKVFGQQGEEFTRFQATEGRMADQELDAYPSPLTSNSLRNRRVQP